MSHDAPCLGTDDLRDALIRSGNSYVELHARAVGDGRFAPEAAAPKMLIPELSAGQIGRREIRGLPNESTPLRNIDPALTPQYAQFGLRIGWY